MPRQPCPNCGSVHDVSIFVTGQRVRCNRCGIRFDVRRDDAPSEPPTQVGDVSDPSSADESPPAPDVPWEQSQGAGSRPSDATERFATDETRISAGLAIPGFDIVRTLGRGGMGEVYLARQVSLGRMVALKVLAHELAKSDEFVRRFEKEAAALAALSHPNIVAIIDRGTVSDTWYFVMELVDGRSLRELLHEGPLPPRTAVNIVAQVCSAIDYAHSRGVIHRDLKPENILVDEKGLVKVADFGLAGIVGGEERMHLTRTDMAMGTFHYMAPEQRRNARDVDARADLYSLGVVLYELITGDVPAGVFKLPSQRMEGLDERLDDIIRQAMEADPADRYQRASAIIEDLQALEGSSRLGSAVLPAPGEKTSPDRPQAKPAGQPGVLVVEPANESVIQRAGRRFSTALMMGAVGIAIAALLVYVFIGSEGRREVRQRLVDEIGENRRDAGVPKATVGTSTPGPLKVPLKHQEGGAGTGKTHLVSDFETRVGEDLPWYTHRGHWVHRDAALVHDVFVDGTAVVDAHPAPRAFIGGERFLAEGLEVMARVVVETRPPDALAPDLARGLRSELDRIQGEEPAKAVLYLYRNKRHYFLIEATLGDDGGYAVRWERDGNGFGGFAAGGRFPEPSDGVEIEMRLAIEDGELRAWVGEQLVGTAPVGELGPEDWGKVGFGCEHAVCRFGFLDLEAYTRPPPTKLNGVHVPTAGQAP